MNAAAACCSRDNVSKSVETLGALLLMDTTLPQGSHVTREPFSENPAILLLIIIIIIDRFYIALLSKLASLACDST